MSTYISRLDLYEAQGSRLCTVCAHMVYTSPEGTLLHVDPMFGHAATLVPPATDAGALAPGYGITYAQRPSEPNAILDLRTADAEDINAALRHWRGWRLAFDTTEAQP